MSTKDYKKGMEAGAKPFEEKFRKQAEATERKVNNINEKLYDIKDIQDSIIDDLSSIEKKNLYSLNTLVDIADMDDTEKNFLVALLYTIANRLSDITEYQQKFIRSVKNYIGIKNVQTEIDISSIENIESINDQKAILQVTMELLFLKAGNFDFLEEFQEEIFDYFSINKKGYNEIKTCILKIYKATGFEGISEKYGYVVVEETEKNEENETVFNELYDGSDICEACADIINVNEKYVILDDYLVYIDCDKDKLYRVSKKDGSIIDIKSELDMDIALNKLDIEMLGCGENIFLLNVVNECIIKININTFQAIVIKLIGEGTQYQCNEDYFIYVNGRYIADQRRLVKIDLRDNSSKVLEYVVNNLNVLTCDKCYLMGKSVYFRPTSDKCYFMGESVCFGSTSEYNNQMNSNTLYKFNLDEETVEAICEIPEDIYNFLSPGCTWHYNNILFSIDGVTSHGQLRYTYLNIENPKAIRNTSIINYGYDTYSFVAYGNVFYVTLDSSMSIKKYNIITGESTVILEATQCAFSYTTGVFKKKTEYSMVGTKPQVVGKWLYYFERTSMNVRKVPIDVIMGKSEKLLIDGKPVNRLM